MRDLKKVYPDKSTKLWTPKKAYHLWLNNEYFGRLEEINKATAIQKARLTASMNKVQIWSINFSAVFNDGNIAAGEV